MSDQFSGHRNSVAAAGANQAPARLLAVGAAAIAVGVVLTGCAHTTSGSASHVESASPSVGPSDTIVPNGPRVAKGALEKMVTDQLAKSGVTPQSVVCLEDLIGKIGQTARCDVTVTPVNGFEPIITVTGVNGSDINYAMVPSVNKTQLESAVADMITRSTKATPDSVSCETGLEGKVGAVAFCNVTTAGTTIRQAVAVSQVQGLSMNYGLAQPGAVPGQAPNTGPGQTLPKSVAEGALMAQLRHSGQNPDSATCAGDLTVQIGATMPCTAVTAGQNKDYVLTVASIVNGNITFNIAPAQ